MGKTERVVYNSFVMNKFALIVGLLVVGMVALVAFLAQSTKDEREPRPIEEVLTIAPDDFVQGNTQSPVVLVEYLDFECPACRANHPLVKELLEQHADRLAVVTRHFPLPFHRNGQTAAWAFEAAVKQKKGAEMADLIFSNQDLWAGKAANAALFYPYAESLGLNMEQFQQDIFSQEVKDKVNRHSLDGRGIGVQATPTFYLNGQRIQGMRSVDDFITAVEQMHAVLETSEKIDSMDNHDAGDHEHEGSDQGEASAPSDTDPAATSVSPVAQ